MAPDREEILLIFSIMYSHLHMKQTKRSIDELHQKRRSHFQILMNLSKDQLIELMNTIDYATEIGVTMTIPLFVVAHSTLNQSQILYNEYNKQRSHS